MDIMRDLYRHDTNKRLFLSWNDVVGARRLMVIRWRGLKYIIASDARRKSQKMENDVLVDVQTSLSQIQCNYKVINIVLLDR